MAYTVRNGKLSFVVGNSRRANAGRGPASRRMKGERFLSVVMLPKKNYHFTKGYRNRAAYAR